MDVSTTAYDGTESIHNTAIADKNFWLGLYRKLGTGIASVIKNGRKVLSSVQVEAIFHRNYSKT